VIFDLGGVVLRWQPRLAYPDVADDELDRYWHEVDWFTGNLALDLGQPVAEHAAEQAARFPWWAHLAEHYGRNFALAIPGGVPGTAGVLAELAQAGIRLLALSNWSAELFARIRDRFGELDLFGGIVLSGEEKLAKPDPAIFRRLFERYGVDPARAVFIDDSPANVAAATALGLTGVPFTDAVALRTELVRLGLLD